LPEDVGSGTHSSCEEFVGQPFGKEAEVNAAQGTVIFFDLKLLPRDVLHLVVAADETHSFSVMIQPLLASPANHMKSSLCEIGLDSLLSYLETLHRPILVGYKIWSMKLPVLVETLRNIDKEERFKAAILGFLDALPLLQEAIPDLTNYTLKYLDSIYLWGQLDESQAFECAKTLKDLCTVLDINPTMMAWGPVVSYSSVQCYCSLQPLLGEKLLSRSSVQTLALHNCSLSVLQSVHQNDPAKGLEKLSRHLNARRRKGEKKIRRLQKIGFFFQALPAGAWHTASAAAQSVMIP
ncbi:Protein PML, partial [Varanus komodoensis]